MSSIVLMNDQREWLGFLLIADYASLSKGGESDFIFTGVPSNPSLFETPECEMILDHKHIEYRAKNKGTKNAISFEVQIEPSITFTLALEKTGTGTWTFKNSDGSVLQGKCEMAAKTRQ